MIIVAVTVLITDRDSRVVGDPIESWTAVNVDLRHNEVSTGDFSAPATRQLLQAVNAAGAQVVVIWNGEYLISGPIERPQYGYKRDGNGQVNVRWADLMVCLGWRITYPNPALPAGDQNVTTYTAAGNSEVLLRNLVYANAGPGALPYRRIPGLDLGPVAGVGEATSVETRCEPLLDVLRRVARAGSLGFRVRRTGARTMVFEVFAPRNRARNVVFSVGRGNVDALDVIPDAPTVTVALVGGSGEGESLPIMEMVDADAVTGWGRMEKWVSQSDSENETAFTQAGRLALLDGAEQVTINVAARNSPGQQYGVDYRVSDLVGVEVGAAAPVVDIVSGVKLKFTPNGGEEIQPTIGNGASKSSAVIAAVRSIDQRLGYVERKPYVSPPVSPGSPIEGTDSWLIANLASVTMTSTVRNGFNAPTSGTVVWPDGTPGVYTADVLSTPHPGAVDGYHITYLGSPTKTVTQPPVTRNVFGSITSQPAIVVT